MKINEFLPFVKETLKPTVLFIVIFLLSSAFACDRIKSMLVKGNPYNNEKFGFTLHYPNGWQVNDTGFMGSAVIFIAKENKLSFKPSVNIFVNSSDGLNLQQYVNRTKEGLNKEIKAVRYKLKKFTGEGEIKLGRYDAYQLIYLFMQNGIHLKARSIIYTEGPLTYMVTCTAEEGDFSKFEKDFDVIIKTFHVSIRK